MKSEIKKMIENVKKHITDDMQEVYTYKGYNTLKLVLNAYNTLQENERDSVDYIFDIENQDDLKCVVNGGMTASEVFSLWLGSQSKHTQYFYFGCNYEKATPIDTIDDLRDTLLIWVDEVLEQVVAYPWLDGYKELYTEYISNTLLYSCSREDIDVLAELKRKLEEGE